MIALFKNRLAIVLSATCFAAIAWYGTVATAQLIRVATPFQTTGDSFFERNGVGFGMGFPGNNRIVGLTPTGQLTPNINISQGSFNGAIPGFGGFDPNSALNTGFASIGGDVNFSFGLSAGKGNRRTLTSQSPSVVVPNGQSGSIFSGSLQPFVTGIRPVVGSGENVASIIRRRRAKANQSIQESISLNGGETVSSRAESRTYSSPTSTATQGAIGVAEIHRRKAMSKVAEDRQLRADVTNLVSAADRLLEQGNLGAARVKYSRALRKLGDNTSMPELREALTAKLKSLRGKR